jgi:ribosomal protein S18 acetylase RimI-like enzyme
MLTEARGLTDRDLAGIAVLEALVVANDGGRLKLEWGTLRARSGEQVDDLLWWEGDRLVGFLGLYGSGQHLEVTGMVDPTSRRRGIGTALLDSALRIASERHFGKVLLIVPRTSQAGRDFALSRGASLEHSEHLLVLGRLLQGRSPTGDPLHDNVVVHPVREEDGGGVRSVWAAAFGAEMADWRPPEPWEQQLVIEREGSVIGALRLSAGGLTAGGLTAGGAGPEGGSTGIYGFAVQPAFQGRGIGRHVLRKVCSELRRDGIERVTLEVAVDNDRALGLYTSVGFERSATDDYWLLTV